VPDPQGAGTSGAALVSSTQQIRAVLRIRDFRLLWISTFASSLGDWLGLLAKTALATELATGYQTKNFALGGVLVSQLLPSLFLGPIAGVFVDRFDRRYTMVFCDIVRFGLFVTIPILHSLTWLFIASFLIECFSVFWRPAKEASVPNLVQRKDQLEAANQLSLITTYGITPVAAAALFAALAWVSRTLGLAIPFFNRHHLDLALYFNAATFVFAAITVATIRSISTHRQRAEITPGASLWSLLREGFSFVSKTKMIRGLVIGMLGAFAAAGTVLSTGKIYAASLGGGDATYGILFGAVFVGLGLGMAFGPRIARDLSRRRLFGLSIVFAGFCLLLVAISPHIVYAVVTIIGVGFGAGVAYLSGMTLLGSEVEDEVRGRTFAFAQSMVQVVLVGTLSVVPFLVGLVRQQEFSIGGAHIVIDGSRFLLAAAGVLGVLVGIVAYRQMDDRPAMPLIKDIISALRGDSTARRRLRRAGVFVAFEGGEGVGKTTQIRLLADWLRARGVATTETREPGATVLGSKVRALLLNTSGEHAPSPRSEALLFAADRAHHVDTVIRPALEGGRVVLTDRYVDSSLAYQGAGRALPVDEVRRLSQWATGGLRPDLTVLLDVDPEIGLRRVDERSAADRLEQESLDFHNRVRKAFHSLAEASPGRYLVIDADAPADQIAAKVRAAVVPLLKDRGMTGLDEPADTVATEDQPTVRIDAQQPTDELTTASERTTETVEQGPG
jgi:dTMP kinase